MDNKRVVIGILLFFLLVGVVNASTTTINASYARAVYEGNDAIFPIIRNGTGSSTESADGTSLYAGYTLATTTSGIFDYHMRGGITFNTSSLPDSATITGGEMGVYINYLYNEDGTVDLELIDFIPADPLTFVAGDYNATTFTQMSANKSYASTPDKYNNFTLNAGGLSKVNKTGYTTFLLDHSASVWDTNLSTTWASGGRSGFKARSYNQEFPPFLTVTYSLPPASSFTIDHAGGISPLLVNFTDISTNTPTAWAWFDGNTLFNSTQNPQYVAFITGNHQIRLNASNADGGTNSSVTWINVTDAPAGVLPIPDFSANVTTCTAPCSLQFTDSSTANILGWNWTFETGGNSTASNPVYTYTTTGSKTVILEVVNISGYNTTTKIDYITVSDLPPVSNFTSNITSGVVPLVVQFNDTSTNTPTSWNWTYQNITPGNNTQIGFSTDQNPLKIFGIGNYSIALNASNSEGSNWSTQTTFVNVSAVVVDTTAPRSITGLSNGTVTNNSILWQWTNPTDIDFNHTVQYKNGVMYYNSSNTTAAIVWTGLTNNTAYTFSSHTVDLSGNMNDTWVNATATTNKFVATVVVSNASPFGVPVDTSAQMSISLVMVLVVAMIGLGVFIIMGSIGGGSIDTEVIVGIIIGVVIIIIFAYVISIISGTMSAIQI